MKRANACLSVVLVLLAYCLVVRSFDPSEIPHEQKRQWCEQQVASCPLICADQNEKNTAETNYCRVRTLQYECVCNNGFRPNSSEYTQTIPYFTCTQEVEDCKGNCNGDSQCIVGCDKECGAKAPPKKKGKDEGDVAGNDTEADTKEEDESGDSDGDDPSDQGQIFDDSASLSTVNGCFAIFLAFALAFYAHI